MNALILLSCLAVGPQSTAQEPPTAPVSSRLDVIVLDNGERFEGRVLVEGDGYIQFELDHGASIGISRHRIAELRRGRGAEVSQHPAALPARDEWFLLHDASGRSVGWLHAAVTSAADGSITLSEEYEFLAGQHRIQITSLCVADAALKPLRCYFRERRIEPVFDITLKPGMRSVWQPERIDAERIVEALCNGDRLDVTRSVGAKRERRSYAWSEGATFPQLARARVRASGEPMAGVEVFDPVTENITARSIAQPRPRMVMLGGKRCRVSEIVETGIHGDNAIWFDRNRVTLRREIAGPTLVALTASANTAREGVGRAQIPSALAREAGREFGLWIPNPAWKLVEDVSAGQVVLFCEAHEATMALARIDHLDAVARADVAADAVANWFGLMHPGLEVGRRETVTTRGTRAVRLTAEGREGNVKTRATATVIAYAGKIFVLTCRAPLRAWAELAPDFAAVLRSLELEPEATAPPLLGRLRERMTSPGDGLRFAAGR